MESIYIGIDWSEDKHDVCFLNKQGATLQEFVIEQSAAGYAKLLQNSTLAKIALLTKK